MGAWRVQSPPIDPIQTGQNETITEVKLRLGDHETAHGRKCPCDLVERESGSSPTEGGVPEGRNLCRTRWLMSVRRRTRVSRRKLAIPAPRETGGLWIAQTCKCTHEGAFAE